MTWERRRGAPWPPKLARRGEERRGQRGRKEGKKEGKEHFLVATQNEDDGGEASNQKGRGGREREREKEREERNVVSPGGRPCRFPELELELELEAGRTGSTDCDATRGRERERARETKKEEARLLSSLFPAGGDSVATESTSNFARKHLEKGEKRFSLEFPRGE